VQISVDADIPAEDGFLRLRDRVEDGGNRVRTDAVAADPAEETAEEGSRAKDVRRIEGHVADFGLVEGNDDGAAVDDRRRADIGAVRRD
jgi:hypothetical protein